MKYWDFLVDAAKPYFVQKIVIYGPESTGKTTLSANLAKHFNTEWIPEFAREYLEAKDSPVELSDIPIIAKGQLALEEEAIKKALSIARKDDIVLITGMGHEQYRIIKGERIPWNDAEIVKKILT